MESRDRQKAKAKYKAWPVTFKHRQKQQKHRQARQKCIYIKASVYRPEKVCWTVGSGVLKSRVDNQQNSLSTQQRNKSAPKWQHHVNALTRCVTRGKWCL